MICTIINGLTKYVKFIFCKTTMTTEKLAKLFLKKKLRITAFLNKSLTTKINYSRQNSIQVCEKFKNEKKYVNSFSSPDGRSNRTNEPNTGTIFQIICKKQ